MRSPTCRAACRASRFILVLATIASAVAGWSAEAPAQGGERTVEVTFEPDVPYETWRRFDLEPLIAGRGRAVEEREQDRLLRMTAARAFTLRGYQHATEGPVDFLIEVVFEPPTDPSPGSIRWSLGKQENWLEIRLRAPDDPATVWRGRAFQVLRRKRNHKPDDDAPIRFLAAAETIARRFPPPPHRPPGARADPDGADPDPVNDSAGTP